MRTDQYMVQLDGLRFFAVAGVAWHHWAPKDFQFSVPWSAGVKLFFVLSGFLITGILIGCRKAVEDKKLTAPQVLKQFYIRRFLRIFPLYYFVLICAALLDLEMVRSSLGWHLAYLSNYYFLGLGYVDSYLSHFWTLSVEEQFYLFWPVIILFVPKRHLFSVILTAILIAPVNRVLMGEDHFNSVVYGFGTLDCLDSLGLGALLALKKSTFTDNALLDWLGKYKQEIGLSGFIVWSFIHILAVWCGWNYWMASLEIFCLNVSFAYLILITSQGLKGVWGKILELSWINYLGKISYGLYVYHLFAGYSVPKIYRFFSAENLLKDNIILSLCSMTVWTIAVASLSWFVFERPINNLKRFFPY